MAKKKGWTEYGRTKDEWAGLHIWFSLLFMIAAFAHLYLNGRSFLRRTVCTMV